MNCVLVQNAYYNRSFFLSFADCFPGSAVYHNFSKYSVHTTHHQHLPCTYFYQVGAVQNKFYCMFDVPSALTAIKKMHKLFLRNLRGNRMLELEISPEDHSRTGWLLTPG